MSIFVQYASSELEGGWNEEKKAQFLDIVSIRLPSMRPFERHYSAQTHHDTMGFGAHLRTNKRTHLPRRIGSATTLLPATITTMVELQNSDSQHVHVRQQHTSRRLHHRRSRTQRGNGNSRGSSMTSYDTIILGSSPNALTAAAYLARGGKRVLVLEPTPHLGGVVSTQNLPMDSSETSV